MDLCERLIREMASIKNSDYFEVDFDDLVQNYNFSVLVKNDFDRLFQFIESNCDIEFGTPGSLVHFMEYFYNEDYNIALTESLYRKPTYLTLVMLNRVINELDESEKRRYISIFQDVINMNISEEVKAEAKHFLDYQMNR